MTGPYRSTEHTPEQTYKLKWYRRASWHKAGTSLLVSAGLVSLLGLTQVGCRNHAISYAKELDPRVRCSAVETHVWGGSGDPDTAVCRLKRESAKTELWACTERSSAEGFSGFPRCVVIATYDAEH